nr:retrotransposon protein, putative, Ty3-gypsy subclass [Tanacetum cinerariifolium]
MERLTGTLAPAQITLMHKEVQFLGHVVNQDGIHVDPSKVESVKNWKTLESPTETRLFLGLAGYYRSVIHTYHKSLQYIFDQKELNMHQKRWIELLNDYECEIKYHRGKANVVADALSKKERLKMRRTDGQSGRTIQTLKDMLRECVMDFGGSWDTHLLLVEFSYNNSYHKRIKCAPFEALYEHSDLQVPLEEIKIDDKLYFVEEPVEIVDRQVKKLKRSWIPIVKVRWDSQRGAEFTWEQEDQFKAKYPHLFATSPSATVVS